jgi:hypothetical protein
MQVFLPVSDVDGSLRILDKRRLGKQRVEAKQLIDTILDRPMASGKPRKGWRNHPAAVMFRRYLPALVYYYNRSLIIFEEAGGKNDKLQPETYCDIPELRPADEPWWWGDPQVHSSHRSRLLFKGGLDLLAARICTFTGDRGPNHWLKSHGLPPLNEFRHHDVEYAESLLARYNAPPSVGQNHYRQFGWTESDDVEYFWPGETANDGIRQVR